uniref:Uncharacterized protein n=1 Tax=Tanacetum cinerariifolium TaxID=118510 RepID=A0A699GJX6_TANCI|nr:hypothetical protein [Tanacetum cinerariifolium]
MPQPMQKLEDSSDPTTAMNAILNLLDKAFKVNIIPTNNNQRSSLIPHNSQIAQLVQYYGNEVGQNAVQNLSIQIVENIRGLSVVLEIINQYWKMLKQHQLRVMVLVLMRKTRGSKALKKKIEFMAVADAYEETERVKVNCTSEDTLQQASTSGTQSDNAPVYDSDGSTKVSEQKGFSKGTRTNTKFTKQSILGKPPSSSFKPRLYSVTPFPNSLVLPKIDKTNALSKPVTSNLAPSTRESKVMQTVNVIASRIFRTNPFKTSRSWKVYLVICSTNYLNGENQVVSKSSTVTTVDASDKRQQQQDSTLSSSTLGTTITADGNFDL